MSITTPLPHAQVDTLAASIVDRFNSGHIPEDQARHDLAELAQRSGIVASLVRQRTAGSDLDRDEIESELTWTVTRKIMNSGDGNYDFSRASGKSLSGFVRRLAGASFASVRRNTQLDPRKRSIPMPPTTDFESTTGNMEPSIQQAADRQLGRGRVGAAFHSPVGTQVDGAVPPADDDVELPETVSRLLRVDEFRPHVQAALLRTAFTLPAPIRPVSRSLRNQLMRHLSGGDGEALAVASLRAHASDDDSVSDATASLMPLWEDFRGEDARVLQSAGPKAVWTVAVSAVADLPRPSNPLLAKVRTRMARDHRKTSPELEVLVPGLVAAAFANDCVPYCSTVRMDLREPMQAAHDSANGMYRTMLHEVAELPGSPMGARPSDVALALREYVLDTVPLPDEDALSWAVLDQVGDEA